MIEFVKSVGRYSVIQQIRFKLFAQLSVAERSWVDDPNANAEFVGFHELIDVTHQLALMGPQIVRDITWLDPTPVGPFDFKHGGEILVVAGQELFLGQRKLIIQIARQ